ncbi:MAG: MaoC/PaaZ C-terminal domain-containing protein, partial [Chloroflexota bacterium]
AGKLNYDDIRVGMEIPTLVKNLSPRQLVKWSGATEEYYEIHYDKDFAISNGLPGIVAPGAMVWSALGQMLTDWLGNQGDVRVLRGSFRGMNLPRQNLYCKGTVTDKYTRDGAQLVACDVWVENGEGQKTITGTAVVSVNP